MLDVSIVIPVKDESENIGPFADEINRIMAPQKWRWECIWIDDGSTDGSLTELKKICTPDTAHRYISFVTNAGQSAALWAGFKESNGRMIATLDGDRQNDPADLPTLIGILEAAPDIDMVNGYRQKRADNFVRKASSRIANAFRNWTTGKTVRDVGCSTRVFRRKCLEGLPMFAGLHRFLPTLVAMRGHRLSETPVNHRPRARGKTKYNINNRLWVGLYDIFGVMWLRKRGFLFQIAATYHQQTDREQLK